MDVGKLAIFLDTVTIGSMKKAAEKYNYTQGGMLYLVNAVEQELGLPVIRRDHRGISWNPAGRELEPFLRQLVEAERELAAKTALLQQRKGRSLTVGAYPSVASLILPQVMNRFLAQGREANITLRMGCQELPDWLESGEIDLAVMQREDGREGDWDWLPLMDLPTVAAIPSAFLDREYDSITMEEFSAFPFLNSTSNSVNETISKLPRAGTRISVSMPDGLGTLRLVSQGLGATGITSLYQDICPKNVEMIPFDPPIVHSYYIVRRGQDIQSTLAEDFIKVLREYCQGYAMSHG